MAASRPPRRTVGRDRRALRLLLRDLQAMGAKVDRPFVEGMAGIVVNWPAVPEDPFAVERKIAREMYLAGRTLTAISTEMGRNPRTSPSGAATYRATSEEAAGTAWTRRR